MKGRKQGREEDNIWECFRKKEGRQEWWNAVKEKKDGRKKEENI